MTKLLRVQFSVDVQDPALSIGMLHGRRDYKSPDYTITREGDVVRIEHLAGIVEVPWNHVAWCFPMPVEEPTSEDRPSAKKRGTK